MLILQKSRQTYHFENVPENSVISFLRNFTAPVIVKNTPNLKEKLHLLAYDTDPFNRYEAGQIFLKSTLIAHYKGEDIANNMSQYCTGLKNILINPNLNSFKSTILSIPSVGYIMQDLNKTDPYKLTESYRVIKEMMAEKLYDIFKTEYQSSFSNKKYDPAPSEAGRRIFNNTLLNYVLSSSKEIDPEIIAQHYNNHNMTDQMGVLSALSYKGGALFDEYMQKFYGTYGDNKLVLDKWFSLQSRRFHVDMLSDIKKLISHKDFTYKNPNRVRSVLSVFCHANLGSFHQQESYDFIVDQILYLDQINPKVASGLATSFENIHLLTDSLRNQAHHALSKIMQNKEKLSNDVYEIIAKIL